VANTEGATRSENQQEQVRDAFDSQNDQFNEVLARAAEALRDSLCVVERSFDEQLKYLLDARSKSETTGAQHLRFQPASRAAEEAFGKAKELLDHVERSSAAATGGIFASPGKQPQVPEAPPAPPADPISVTDQLMSRAIGSLDSAMEAIVSAINSGTIGSPKE
jgi:hypothetical protein